jgi:hypothetical protein
MIHMITVDKTKMLAQRGSNCRKHGRRMVFCRRSRKQNLNSNTYILQNFELETIKVEKVRFATLNVVIITIFENKDNYMP